MQQVGKDLEKILVKLAESAEQEEMDSSDSLLAWGSGQSMEVLTPYPEAQSMENLPPKEVLLESIHCREKANTLFCISESC